jgi:UDP-glucose 4-epimerase
MTYRAVTNTTLGRHSFHCLNLSKTPALADVLVRERIDAVVHFAAFATVGESTEHPELYFSNNVGGTLSLLNAMSLARVKRLVFSSTAAVYGIPRRCPSRKMRSWLRSIPMASPKFRWRGC